VQEPWIGYLLTFHVFLLTAAVLKRRSQAVTAAIFFLSSASSSGRTLGLCSTALGSCCVRRVPKLRLIRVMSSCTAGCHLKTMRLASHALCLLEPSAAMSYLVSAE
jgi:hypothetical protein